MGGGGGGQGGGGQGGGRAAAAEWAAAAAAGRRRRRGGGGRAAVWVVVAARTGKTRTRTSGSITAVRQPAATGGQNQNQQNQNRWRRQPRSEPESAEPGQFSNRGQNQFQNQSQFNNQGQNRDNPQCSNRGRNQFQTFQPQYQQRGNRNYLQRRQCPIHPAQRQRSLPALRSQRAGSTLRQQQSHCDVSPSGGRIVTITDPNGRLHSPLAFRERPRIHHHRQPLLRRAAAGCVLRHTAAAGHPHSAGPLHRRCRRCAARIRLRRADGAAGRRRAAAYTLDEIRFSPDVRNLMPRVDLDTITFASSRRTSRRISINRLAPIADGIKRAVAQNPSEVFLIEGHTDAVGRNRGKSVAVRSSRRSASAEVLTSQFQVPPENLTTQGYGEQQLKIPTQGPERVNRRVTVRRITPLLQQGQAQPQDDQPDDQQQGDQQQNRPTAAICSAAAATIRAAAALI